MELHVLLVPDEEHAVVGVDAGAVLVPGAGCDVEVLKAAVGAVTEPALAAAVRIALDIAARE